MKHAVITGANRGIGLELCRQLNEKGFRVSGVCRSPSPRLEALGVGVFDGIDVTSDDSVATLVKSLAGSQVDWLINNAGILFRDDLSSLDYHKAEAQFRVNAIGPLRVSRALLPLMERGARIGIVTSRMGSVGDNSSGRYYGYRMSKAAVNIAGKSLALDLAGRGIAVGLLHPGMVATDMTGGEGEPVEMAARGLIDRMEELDLSNSGTFWHAKGDILPW